METFKKYSHFGALGLLAYMPFHIFLSQWLSTFTGGLDTWKIAKDVFTALLVSVVVLTVLITRKYTKLYLGLIGFAIVYLLLHLILWFTTNQPTDTGLLATVYNNRIIWYLLIGYGLALLVPRLANPRLYVRVLIIVSTIVCLIGLLQWILPKDLMTHFGYSIERGVKPNFFIDDKPDLPRIMSTIRDPNSLGAFLILPITIIFDALLRFWRTKRMFFGGLLLLHGLILFLTFSRSAWLGAVLAVGTLLALRYGKQLRAYLPKVWLPALALLIIVSGSIYLLRDQYIIQNVVFHSDESTSADDPNELRVKLFEESVQGVVEDPEGHGPGTAGLVSIRRPQTGLLTENYYLQIGYEIGLLGLAMFIGFLAIVLLRLWRNRPDNNAEALLASFIGLVFVNWLLHGWANEAVAVSWFMLAGTTLVSFQEKRKL
jgi:hypothetical protein